MVSQFTNEHCAPFFPVPGNLIGYHYVRSGRMFAADRTADRRCVSSAAVSCCCRATTRICCTAARASSRGRGRAGRSVSTRAFSGSSSRATARRPKCIAAISAFRRATTRCSTACRRCSPSTCAPTASSGSKARCAMVAEEELRRRICVARLAELFFAEAIRDLHGCASAGPGRLARGPAGIRRSRGRCAVIHARYAEDLDIETLAREAGVSRSVLGERFAALIGEPPMRYCARWRMRIAANMLRDGKHNAANIAYAVGFNSRGRVQPRVQARIWRAAGDLAAAGRGRSQRAREAAAARRCRSRWCVTAPPRTARGWPIRSVGEGPPLVKTANWLNHIEHDWKSPLWRHWIQELTSGHTLVRYDERGQRHVRLGHAGDFVRRLRRRSRMRGRLRRARRVRPARDQPGRGGRDRLRGPPPRARAPAGDRAAAMRRAGRRAPTRRRSPGARRCSRSPRSAGARTIPAYRQLFTNLYIPGAIARRRQQWFNEMQRLSRIARECGQAAARASRRSTSATCCRR